MMPETASRSGTFLSCAFLAHCFATTIVQATSQAGANVVLCRELLRAPSTAAGGGGYQWEQSAANSLVLPTTTCNGWPAAVSVEVFALHRPDPK